MRSTGARSIDLGFTPRMIEHRRAIGAWVTLAPSVYALASHPYTWLRQAKAAELSIPGSALSHRAAAVPPRLRGLSSRAHRPHRARWQPPRQPVGDGAPQPRARGRPPPGDRGDARWLARWPTSPAWSIRGRSSGRSTGAPAEQRLHRRRAEARGRVGRRPSGSAGSAELRAARRGSRRRLRPAGRASSKPSCTPLLDDPRLPPLRAAGAVPVVAGCAAAGRRAHPEWRLIVEADGRRWHTRVRRLRARPGPGPPGQAPRLRRRAPHPPPDLRGSTRYAVELLLEIGSHLDRAA